jgi:hypothetical protein
VFNRYSVNGKFYILYQALQFLAICGLFQLLVVQNAYALRLNISPGIAAGYSDNIDRLPDDEKEGARQIAGLLEMNLLEDSPVFQADISSSVEYWDYSAGSTTDETRIFLDGTASWKLRPQSIEWFIENHARQTKIASFEADSPANRQMTNAFSTGPDLFFPIGRPYRLEIGARYTRFDFEESSDADSVQPSVFARLVYDISSADIFNVTTDFRKVDFKDETTSDFNHYETFITYNSVRGRSELTFDLGSTYIDREFRQNIKAPLGRFRFVFEALPEQRLEAFFLGQYNDSGQDFLSKSADRDRERFTLGSTGSTQVSTDIFFEKRGEIRYESTPWRRTRLTLRALWSDEDYEEQFELDRETISGSGGVSHVFTPRLSGSFLGEYQMIDYKSIEQKDNEFRLEARLSYSLNRRLSLGLVVRRDERKSTDPTKSFKENAIFLGLDYNRSGRWSMSR